MPKSLFECPPAIVEMVNENVNIGFEALSEDGGHVQVMCLPPDHAMMQVPPGGVTVAKAARTSRNEELILVNTGQFEDLSEEVILHEVAHLITWRRHGIRVAEHGSKFKRVEREIRNILNKGAGI